MLVIIVKTLFKERHKLVNVLVVRVRAVERTAIVVEQHVERLRVGTELAALQVAPLVAHGAKRGSLSVLLHLDGFGQRSLLDRKSVV